MTFLLFSKVAVRLAHLLQARLSPLAFLLNLSLLTLLLRILLGLASSPHLHTFLMSTSAALQGLTLNNLRAVLVFKACDNRIMDLVLFVAANFIILALFFSSKRASATSSRALNQQYAYLDQFEGIDADEAFDILAEDNIIRPSNELPNMASANSSCCSMQPSSPIELVPTIDTISRENSIQKSLFRHKSDTQARSRPANKYEYYARTAGCTYYYEYTREGACSTSRLYTASSVDMLSKEEARKHFSQFTPSSGMAKRRQKQIAGNP